MEQWNGVGTAKRALRRYISLECGLTPTDQQITLDEIHEIWFAQLGKDWMGFFKVDSVGRKRFLLKYDSGSHGIYVETFSVIGNVAIIDKKDVGIIV